MGVQEAAREPGGRRRFGGDRLTEDERGSGRRRPGRGADPGRFRRAADRGAVGRAAGQGRGGERATRSTSRTSSSTKQRLGGAFELQAGAVHAVPFGLEIPWETPVTMFDGQALRGMHDRGDDGAGDRAGRGLRRPGPGQRASAAGAEGDPGRVRPAGLPLQGRGHGARAHPGHAAAAAVLPGDRVLPAVSSTGG